MKGLYWVLNKTRKYDYTNSFLMKYTDIAWDFDGTLFDTYPSMVRDFKETLENFGYIVPKEEIHLKMAVSIGYAATYYAEKYKIDMAAMLQLFKEKQHKKGVRMDEVNIYPGVSEVLKRIKESGRRNHLYTNRSCVAVRYLEAFNLCQYFSGIVTRENIGKLKPAPDGMIILLNQYHIEPKKMLMVGDRAVDIDAAKAAGAGACFYNTNRIMVPQNTDFEIESMEDLLKYL